MDRTGEQLRYSNRIVNSVALKSDTRIGFCEMYQSNNGCLCMSVNRKNSEFNSFAECSGMCTKQNINIYIENFDAKINNGQYDLKCKSVKESNYSFYKTVEQNSSSNKAFYADVAWLETNDKQKCMKHNSSLNYCPYNRQYLPESVPYVRKEIENKHINNNHFNLSQGVENSSNNENRTYMLREIVDEDKAILNRFQDKNVSHIVSGNMPSSSCSNLYVAPPYFTVDKFVNEENPLNRSISQNVQFYNENVFNYERMPKNVEENSFKNSLVPNRTVHDEDIIGIKIAANPDIPYGHFETSIKPISFDITKRSRYLPIKKEKCNYENDFLLDSNFKTETNVNDINSGYDLDSSKSSPVSQYNCTEGQGLESKISHELVGVRPVYSKVRNSEDLQFAHFRGNSKHEICKNQNTNSIIPYNSKHEICKNQNTNIIIPSSKNLLREVRKPNYRELINHVHALRNATSENDLNMQIIKRTLNYNQKPKEITTCNLVPRQFDYKLNKLDPIYVKEPSNLNNQDNLFNSLTSNVTPLDLSVKTVKSNADSTASDSCCKILISENGYPPKFNFKPNFSDNRCISDDSDIKAVERESFKFGISRDHIEESQTNEVIETPRHISECCNQPQDNLNVIGCCLKNEENEILLQASLPKLQDNCVCSLQNCLPVQKCMSKDFGHGNGCKVEVTLKRSAPFKSDIEKEYDKKKMCAESFYYSETDSKTQIKILDVTPGKASSNNNQNLPKSNLISELKNHIDNTKPEFEYKTATSVNESVQTNIEVKPDDSSIIAARIRTKAELKGFIFHEDKQDYFNEQLSNKENYQCNDGSKLFTQVDDSVDLIEWKNACNSFVNQLIQDGLNSQNGNEEQKNFGNKNQDSEFKTNFLEKKESISPPENKFGLGSNDLFAKIIDNSLSAINSTFECNKYLGTNDKTGPKSEINHVKSDYSKSKYSLGYKVKPYNTNIVKIEPKNENKHINHSSLIQRPEVPNKSCIANIEISTDGDDGKIEFNKNNSFQNNIDLKKISVVRLKREKYGSKRYTQYDNGSERTAKANLVPNCSKNTSKNITRTKPSAICEDDTSTNYQRQSRHVKAKGSIDLKSTAITTRLRHHMLQLKNKSELKSKSNKTQKSEANTNIFRRHNIEKDHEALNDIDKLYLEVYRYKRALKIPPNLITIRNSCKQGISSSLPDLDIDIQSSSLQNEKSNNSDFKVEEVPKSIIDVLHSRVLKSKNQTKNNIRHTKNENQRAFQSKIEQCNNRSVNLKQSNSTENNNCSNREYRNVFETQILSSRTRTEYKMQLNKEVIREIFGGTERPASAPPEINNIKNDFQLVLEQHYSNFFNNSSDNFMHEIGGQQEKYSLCSHGNLQEAKTLQNEGPNKNVPSGMNVNCRQKKCGRSYRRKFSSGFDYLRKKKKTKTRALYKYTQLKSRVENYIESTQYIKNEDDVSREIQKWVLNKSVGQSALHKAARLGYIDVIVYCLERMGLNPDHKDNAGYTPLHDACVNGSLEIARLLLQYGANHSEGAHSGIRPLHEASENGHIEVVRMLLSYGADPLLETYSGQTPLMLASESKMSDFISKHLLDIQMDDIGRKAWRFPGPWKIFDNTESGYNSLSDIQSHTDDRICYKNKKYYHADAQYVQDNKNVCISKVIKEVKPSRKNNSYLKNDICEFEILVDATDADGELFEFEEANMPLPPLYMLSGEGMEKWVLLSDLCSLLKVKSKDTLLHKIFPSISPTTVSRAFIRELKMCDFLEKATCLQLLCAGEKINICHSKVVLVQYNENVRKLLGVKTILMKF